MIEYHADDYGLFPEQSKRIIRCMDEGALNGISLMPNSPYLDECMKMLGDRKPLLTVHLNLVEGKALSYKEGQPNPLTDDKGIFNVSFGKLLIASYIPGMRGRFFAALKEELGLQIKACLPYYGDMPVRLDGHCHFHMVPVVFDALTAAIEENGINVSYIRVPAENVPAYNRHKQELEGRTAINMVKVFILNTLSHRDIRSYRAFFEKNPPAPFMGVYLSGHMVPENIKAMYDEILKAEKESSAHMIEVLFHPGAVTEEDDIRQLTSSDDVTFLTSPLRGREAQSLVQLRSMGQ